MKQTVIKFILFTILFFTAGKSFSQIYDGRYSVISSDSCDIRFTLTGNKYNATVAKKAYSGMIKFSSSNGASGELKLIGLKSNYPEQDINLRYEDGTLFIQNYGNSMNEFVQFKDCSDKFIIMKKDI